jgi:hypothetical protein
VIVAMITENTEKPRASTNRITIGRYIDSI